MSRSLRILLIAEACNPEWTSVPLLAFYWYRALKTRVRVTLVTQLRNRPALMRCLDEDDEVIFIDSEKVARRCSELGRMVSGGAEGSLGIRGAMSWPAYVYFEQLLWKMLRTRLQRGDFDLVHRLTPLSPIFPSPLAGRCPVPFVMGPLNGSLPWPRGMDHIRAREGERLSRLRRLYRVLPYWRQTFERSACNIVAARHVFRELPRRARERAVLLPENGVDTDVFSPNGARASSGKRPFTILFVGRLIPLKQPALILEAVARMPSREGVRVVYIGAGPEKTVLMQATERLGLSGQVQILGHVPHAQLPGHYCSASLLALPSIHESGGAVLLEAMACGVPCAVLDYGGPGEYVTKETGVLVPLGRTPQMVDDFASAFATLRQDANRLQQMSDAARERVRTQFTWDAKVSQMVQIYRSLR